MSDKAKKMALEYYSNTGSDGLEAIIDRHLAEYRKQVLADAIPKLAEALVNAEGPGDCAAPVMLSIAFGMGKISRIQVRDGFTVAIKEFLEVLHA